MQSLEFLVKDDDSEFEQKYPKGLTLPDLLPFYHAIARNDPIKLEWVCHGKLALSSVKEAACTTTTSTTFTKSVNVSQSKLLNPGTASKLAEFDFDEANQLEVSAAGVQSPASNKTSFRTSTTSVSTPGPLPLRRVCGTNRSTPKQPRVANMDKILNDFFRTRKETNAPPPQPVVSSTPNILQSDTSMHNASAGDHEVPVVHAALLKIPEPSPLSKEPVVTTQAVVSDSDTVMELTTLPMGHLTVTDNLASSDANNDTFHSTMDTAGADVVVEAATMHAGVLSPPTISGSHRKNDVQLPIPKTSEDVNNCAAGLDSSVVESEMKCEGPIPAPNSSHIVNHGSVSNL